VRTDVQKQNFFLIEEDKFYAILIIYPKSPGVPVLAVKLMSTEAWIKCVFPKNELTLFRFFGNLAGEARQMF
jgi:hypothetical protein